MKTTAPPSTVTPVLLRRQDVARMLSIGTATLDRWTAAGRTPRPVKPTPGVLRFRAADVHRWIALGCPPRDEFERCVAVGE